MLKSVEVSICEIYILLIIVWNTAFERCSGNRHYEGPKNETSPLNGSLLVHADNVTLLGENINTLKEKPKTLQKASKELGK